MPRKKKIDEIDIAIINALSQNGSLSNIKLSKKVGLAPMPTLNRVNKLKELGYIGNSTTTVNLEKFGYLLVTYQIVEIKNGFGNLFKSIINKLKNVTQLQRLTNLHFDGNPNEKYGVTMYSKNSEDLRTTLETAFSNTDFIVKVDTMVIDEKHIQKTSINLDPESDIIK